MEAVESNYLISRQPIFDAKIALAGYELRAHSGELSDGFDPSATILTMCTDAGLDSLAGEHPCTVPLTRKALAEGLWVDTPQSRVVFSFLEDFEPTDALVEQLSNLAQSGYRLVLADRLHPESLGLLADLAYAIRLDITSYRPRDLDSRIRFLRRYKSKIFVDRVNTYDDLEFCRSLPVDLYQGHFLSKPGVPKHEVPVNRLAMMRLLAKIQDENTPIHELKNMISMDVALSYKLLQYTNSAALGLGRNVSSIDHAVRLIGLNTLRSWASVLLLSSVEDKPAELMNLALIRAGMCELLGESQKDTPKESFFFAGLLSVLDALLDCSMVEALEELPLSEEVRDALLQQAGPIGQALRCAIAYEQAEWHEVEFYGMPPAAIRGNYMSAVAWARQLLRDLPK